MCQKLVCRYLIGPKIPSLITSFVTPAMFFCSESFAKNYTEEEVADAITNTLKRAPDRKDGGGPIKELIVEDLN